MSSKSRPKKVRIMQIGVGFHARRIYIPRVRELSERYPVDIIAGVDIIAAKETIDSYLKDRSLNIKMLYLKPFDGPNLSSTQKAQLTKFAKLHGINAVIISTDPTTHKTFAMWAIENGLHILMDKPISTREQVSTSLDQAQALNHDYRDILDAYSSSPLGDDMVFSVMVQRRYEPGYLKVFSLIREVAEKFNAPVTSIQASHSDGVWIFPDEIVEQKSHPYSTGYGKNSHSGYHIFDIIWQLYSAANLPAKQADKGEVMTSFLNPRGLLQQFGQSDFMRYFSDYNSIKHRSDEELWDIFERYGEIDAFSLIRLLKNNDTICNISTNLIHNGFSRRSWSRANADLYKGNGRVKHQTYNIQQGPFQNIQIHQYQSEDKHDEGYEHEEAVGGNNHFDIFVFRNAEMFGDGEHPFTKYTPKEFAANFSLNTKRLHNETAKDSVIIEFIECIIGTKPKSMMKSSIESHEMPVKIMSAIYQSQVSQTQGGTPLIGFRIGDK